MYTFCQMYWANEKKHVRWNINFPLSLFFLISGLSSGLHKQGFSIFYHSLRFDCGVLFGNVWNIDWSDWEGLLNAHSCFNVDITNTVANFLQNSMKEMNASLYIASLNSTYTHAHSLMGNIDFLKTFFFRPLIYQSFISKRYTHAERERNIRFTIVSNESYNSICL